MFFLFLAVLPVSSVFANNPEDLFARAEAGDFNAQCFIGHMYLSGKGLEQDFEKARFWYERVRDQQGADAKIVAHANLVLGVLYNSGKGGKQCSRTALQCFENAAEQGYTDAHINIGLIYAKGLGVPKDLRKALYWWQLAEEKGHPSAAKYVFELKKKLALAG
ncbi:MAG: sel1 repeat family protein [Desulforhopalus sp.]|nr:sel1 repeat family protein [Desulforhopalus sp.]